MHRKAVSATPIALAFLLTAALLGGCGQQIDPEDIHGQWSYKLTVDPSQTASMAENPPPEGVGMSMDIKAVQTFASDSTYELDTRMDMLISSDKGDTLLEFRIMKTGIWEIDGDQLLETTESAEVSPENPVAAAALEGSPQLAKDLAGAEAETTAARILEVTQSVMVLQDEENDVRLELRRVEAE